ncbi:potassium-transporting ATPase subunit KdpC [Isoptericola hypogeus]
MSSGPGGTLTRQALAGARVLLAFTLLLGLAYPFAVTGIGQTLFGWRADGSLVTADGSATRDRDEAVGSALLGQPFDGAEWFHPRPSAAGDGYDTLASAGSNLGPESPDLLAAIADRKAEVAATEGVDPAVVPPDAVTASGSGLDPHISPEYAAIQVARVADARGLTDGEVRGLVAEHTRGRSLGVLGDPRVDVLALNQALDRLSPQP